MLPYSSASRWLQIAETGGRTRYINMDHELFAAALTMDLDLECTSVDGFVEKVFEGTDRDTRFDTFQVLIDQTKSLEADLISTIKKAGIDDYERTDIGACDSKTYEVEMAQIRIKVLRMMNNSLTSSVSKVLLGGDRFWRRTGTAWSAAVGSATGVMITQIRSAQSRELLSAIVRKHRERDIAPDQLPSEGAAVFAEAAVDKWHEDWPDKFHRSIRDEVMASKSTGERSDLEPDLKLLGSFASSVAAFIMPAQSDSGKVKSE